jgi:hypothetical protein
LRSYVCKGIEGATRVNIFAQRKGEKEKINIRITSFSPFLCAKKNAVKEIEAKALLLTRGLTLS